MPNWRLGALVSGKKGSNQNSGSNSPRKVGSETSEDMLAHLVSLGSERGSPRWQVDDAEDTHESAWSSPYLAITVREAKDLPIADTSTASSDPYVVLKLGTGTFRTRVVYRNRNPVWEQLFLVSVESLSKNALLHIEVYDKDLFGAEFLSEATLQLATIDAAITAGAGEAYWVPLRSRGPGASKLGSRPNSWTSGMGAGDICLRCEWIPPARCAEVAKMVEDRCDPAHMCAHFGDKEAVVSIDGIGGFLHSGINPRLIATPIYLQIKVGSVTVDKKVQATLSDNGDIVFNGEDGRLRLPLGQAFRKTLALNPKKDVRDEMQDLKITIKDLNKITIAKTQIPLWDVPMPSSQGSATDPAKNSPFSAAAAEPEVKVYRRTMENWIPARNQMELVATVRLATVSPTAGAAVVAEEAGDVEDDDVDSAEPITAPAPLANIVCDMVVSVGVAQLFKLMFNADSQVVAKLNEQEKLREMSVGGWMQEAGSNVKSRIVKYIKPLNIPIPFAPKQTEVTEEQKVLLKEAGGFVVETRLTTKAGGDGFYVRIQHVGQFYKSGQAKLVVSMQVDFVKSVMAKGLIESQSIADSKKTWAAFKVALAEFIGQPQPSGDSFTADAAPAAPAAAAAPAAVAPAWERVLSLLGTVLVIVLLLWLLLEVRSAARTIGGELGALRVGLQAAREGSCSATAAAGSE